MNVVTSGNSKETHSALDSQPYLSHLHLNDSVQNTFNTTKDIPSFLIQPGKNICIPKSTSSVNLFYSLYVPKFQIKTKLCSDGDVIVYLGKGQFYELNLQYKPTSHVAIPSRFSRLKSTIMIVCREAMNPSEEKKAWKYWRKKKHCRQRILEVRELSESNLSNHGQKVVIDVHENKRLNVATVFWTAEESLVKLEIAIHAACTEFVNELLEIPFHIHIETYRAEKNTLPIHSAYIPVKVFSDKYNEPYSDKQTENTCSIQMYSINFNFLENDSKDFKEIVSNISPYLINDDASLVKNKTIQCNKNNKSCKNEEIGGLKTSGINNVNFMRKAKKSPSIIQPVVNKKSRKKQTYTKRNDLKKCNIKTKELRIVLTRLEDAIKNDFEVLKYGKKICKKLKRYNISSVQNFSTEVKMKSKIKYNSFSGNKIGKFENHKKRESKSGNKTLKENIQKSKIKEFNEKTQFFIENIKAGDQIIKVNNYDVMEIKQKNEDKVFQSTTLLLEEQIKKEVQIDDYVKKETNEEEVKEENSTDSTREQDLFDENVKEKKEIGMTLSANIVKWEKMKNEMNVIIKCEEKKEIEISDTIEEKLQNYKESVDILKDNDDANNKLYFETKIENKKEEKDVKYFSESDETTNENKCSIQENIYNLNHYQIKKSEKVKRSIQNKIKKYQRKLKSDRMLRILENQNWISETETSDTKIKLKIKLAPGNLNTQQNNIVKKNCTINPILNDSYDHSKNEHESNLDNQNIQTLDSSFIIKPLEVSKNDDNKSNELDKNEYTIESKKNTNNNYESNLNKASTHKDSFEDCRNINKNKELIKTEIHLIDSFDDSYFSYEIKEFGNNNELTLKPNLDEPFKNPKDCHNNDLDNSNEHSIESILVESFNDSSSNDANNELYKSDLSIIDLSLTDKVVEDSKIDYKSNPFDINIKHIVDSNFICEEDSNNNHENSNSSKDNISIVDLDFITEPLEDSKKEDESKNLNNICKSSLDFYELLNDSSKDYENKQLYKDIPLVDSSLIVDPLEDSNNNAENSDLEKSATQIIDSAIKFEQMQDFIRDQEDKELIQNNDSKDLFEDFSHQMQEETKNDNKIFDSNIMENDKCGIELQERSIFGQTIDHSPKLSEKNLNDSFEEMDSLNSTDDLLPPVLEPYDIDDKYKSLKQKILKKIFLRKLKRKVLLENLMEIACLRQRQLQDDIQKYANLNIKMHDNSSDYNKSEEVSSSEIKNNANKLDDDCVSYKSDVNEDEKFDWPSFVKYPGRHIDIPKKYPAKGFFYILDIPTLNNHSVKEDRFTFLHKRKYYRLILKYIADEQNPLFRKTVYSRIKLKLRESVILEQENLAWDLWKKRQSQFGLSFCEIMDARIPVPHSSKTRLKRTASEEFVVIWDSSERKCIIDIAICCTSSEFYKKNSLVPFHLQIDTFCDSLYLDSGYCQIIVLVNPYILDLYYSMMKDQYFSKSMSKRRKYHPPSSSTKFYSINKGACTVRQDYSSRELSFSDLSSEDCTEDSDSSLSSSTSYDSVTTRYSITTTEDDSSLSEDSIDVSSIMDVDGDSSNENNSQVPYFVKYSNESDLYSEVNFNYYFEDIDFTIKNTDDYKILFLKKDLFCTLNLEHASENEILITKPIQIIIRLTFGKAKSEKDELLCWQKWQQNHSFAEPVLETQYLIIDKIVQDKPLNIKNVAMNSLCIKVDPNQSKTSIQIAFHCESSEFYSCKNLTPFHLEIDVYYKGIPVHSAYCPVIVINSRDFEAGINNIKRCSNNAYSLLNNTLERSHLYSMNKMKNKNENIPRILEQNVNKEPILTDNRKNLNENLFENNRLMVMSTEEITISSRESSGSNETLRCDVPVFLQQPRKNINIPKLKSEIGFFYYLDVPLFNFQSIEEDRVTHIVKEISYPLIMQYIRESQKQLTNPIVSSHIKLTFRESETSTEDDKAWQIWLNSRTNSSLDIPPKAIKGIIVPPKNHYHEDGKSLTQEGYIDCSNRPNAMVVTWDTTFGSVCIDLSIFCASSEFFCKRLVPFHIQIDTFCNRELIHSGYLHIKVFPNLSVLNYHEEKLQVLRDNSSIIEYHPACTRSEFYSIDQNLAKNSNDFGDQSKYIPRLDNVENIPNEREENDHLVPLEQWIRIKSDCKFIDVSNPEKRNKFRGNLSSCSIDEDYDDVFYETNEDDNLDLNINNVENISANNFPRFLKYPGKKVHIKKQYCDVGFFYYLEAPTFNLQPLEEDRLTYLEMSRFYRLTLKYIPESINELSTTIVKSHISLLFREAQTEKDANLAWKVWRSVNKQRAKYRNLIYGSSAPCQRILEVNLPYSIDLTNHKRFAKTSTLKNDTPNSVTVIWNTSDESNAIELAIHCASSEFYDIHHSVPFHIHVDTFCDKKLVHSGYCQVITFSCHQIIERRLAKMKKDLKSQGDSKERYHSPNQRSEFYSIKLK